jgi:uncharacterized membrane protein YuzA (DUF378 family)
MKWLNLITLAFVIMGGLAWGAIALGEPNFLETMFGGADGARTVYALIGMSALWQIVPLVKAVYVGEPKAEATLHRPLVR